MKPPPSHPGGACTLVSYCQTVPGTWISLPMATGAVCRLGRVCCRTSANGNIILLNQNEVASMWFSISLKRTRDFLKGPSLLFFLLALSISSCASKTGSYAVASYNDDPLSVTIPSNASAEFVEMSMVRVLKGRDWVVQSQTKEKVVGKLVHRGWNATVTLLSDGSVVRIMSDATQTNISTGEVNPAVPLGWLRNIQKDLDAALASQ